MPLFSKLAGHLEHLVGVPVDRNPPGGLLASVAFAPYGAADPLHEGAPRARLVLSRHAARTRPLPRRRSKSMSAAPCCDTEYHGRRLRRHSMCAVRISGIWEVRPGTPGALHTRQDATCRTRAVVLQLESAVEKGDESQILVALDSFCALPPAERDNAATYNSVLGALCAARPSVALMRRVTTIYRRMRASGPHLDQSTYALMVELLCRSATLRRSASARSTDLALAESQFQEALQIASTAHTEHHPFQNTAVYNSLLAYCALCGNTSGAVGVLELLEQSVACKADPASYAYLIDAFVADRSRHANESAAEQRQRRSAACEQIFEAFEFAAATALPIQELAERWSAPKKAVVWAAMLRARVELGDAAGAVTLFERMMSQGGQDCSVPAVDEGAVSALVHGFVRIGDYDAAVQWLGQVCSAGLPRPSVAALDELFGALEQEQPSTCFVAHRRLLSLLSQWLETATDDLCVCGYSAAAAAAALERTHAGKAQKEADAVADALDVFLGRFFGAAKASQESVCVAAAATVRLVTRYALLGRASDAARFFGHVVTALRHLDNDAPSVLPLVRDACHLPMAIADAGAQSAQASERFVVLASKIAPALHRYSGSISDALNAALVRLYSAASRELNGDFGALQLDRTTWQHVLEAFCGEEHAAHRDDLGVMRRLGIGLLISDLERLEGGRLLRQLDLTPVRDLLATKYGSEGTEALDSWLAGADRDVSEPGDVSTEVTGTVARHLAPVRRVDILLGNQLNSIARPGADMNHEDAYDILKEHVSNGIYPPPSTVVPMLCGFGRDGDLKHVDELYAIAQHVIAAQHRNLESRLRGWVQVEDAMITALSHSGESARANAHRERIVAASQVPSASAYAALIATIQERTDDAAIAEDLFNESQRLGVRPTTYLFNTVISKLSRARKAEQALQLFDMMRIARVRPTSVTFGAAINACVRTGDEARATALFAEMESQKSFQPRVPPYNTMIQYYVYSRPQREQALLYFKKMQEAGVRPSAHTYKLLLDMWGTIDPVQPEQQQSVFAKLTADRLVSVQGTHWASLIHTQGSVLHNLDRAMEIFDSIADHAPARGPGASTVPDAVVYEAMIAVFVAHDRTDLMPAYTTRMLGQGIMPTAYIANLLIKGYAADGPLGLAEARRVFNSMSDPPAGVAAAGNHLPRHHGAGALRQFRERPSPRGSNLARDSANVLGAHVNREPSTYEAMIRAELSHGNTAEARNVLERMKARAFPAALVNRARALFDTQ